MKVKSENVEFGYELISALPYAYSLYEKGLLKETESGADTSCLYYFSPKHKENKNKRGWHNMRNAANLPNISIHKPSLDFKNFSPPPLKEQYKNDRFIFDKPIVCICNRINVEWGREVINYFDIPTLEKLFTDLKEKYHIVYFNIEGRPEHYDGVKPVNIGDYELCKKHCITNIHELLKENKDLSFNELQLMVMANAEYFITMNGGYSILCSYFGGTNVIYSKECKELKPTVNSFYRWYHKFGGSRIIHVDNYAELHKQVDCHLIKKLPTVNILIRTHNRPNYFSDCYKSIVRQTYPNINIITGYYSESADKYLIPYKVRPLKYDEFTGEIPLKEDSVNYGAPFGHNSYMNNFKSEIKDGYVIWLDDDDAFNDNTAVAQIVSKIKSENDLVLWRTKVGDRLIPSAKNFRSKPVVRDIAGTTFCCHSKHFNQHNFEPYRRADFRLISELYKKLTPKYIDKILTIPQNGRCNMGNGQDKKSEKEIAVLSVALPIWNSKEIAWLALEGLCRQKGVDFEWELIICEEKQNAFGQEEVVKYVERLKKVGCVRVLYVSLDFKITLPNKWRMIAEKISTSSKVFILQSADDFSEPNRLKNSYDLIVNKGHDWVQNKKTVMYNVKNGKTLLYNPNSYGYPTGLNMAVSTELLGKLQPSFILRGVDRWFINSAAPKKLLWLDNELDGGCHTFGLNNISLDNKKYFDVPRPPFYKTDVKIETILPKEILTKLQTLKTAK